MSDSSQDDSPGPARQALIATLILAVGASAALVIRFSGEKAVTTLDDLPRDRPTVVVASAREIPLRASATFAGRLAARRSVDLTPEIAGRLVDIKADVGDSLSAGATAFLLDDRDARLATEDRRARLAAAEARERQARRRSERRQRLGEAGISSPEDVEQAQLDGDVTGADLVVARQELLQAERQLEKTIIHAPWSGTVVARHADPGAWLSAGQNVLRLVDLSKVDVRVDIPASDAVHLEAGDLIQVRFPALPGETFEGRVRFVASQASDEDHQFPVAIELPGAPRLGVGMIAEVDLELPRAGRGVGIPIGAIQRQDGEPFVWLLDGDRVRRRSLVLAGARGGAAVVTAGLTAGDLVVVTVAAPLEDGLEVEVQTP